VCTTLTGFLGAWVARLFLDKIPQKVFDLGLKTLLFALAVTMIIRGTGLELI
jgi:uncharacterized membrane protein YfcA